MKKTLLYILTIINLAAFAQEDSSHWELDPKSDTTFYYSYHKDMLDYFGFQEIAKINSNLIFRLWRPSSYLEITESAYVYEGKLTFFIIENSDNAEEPNIFIKIYILPKDIINKTLSLISSTGISNLGSDKFITGWKKGLDGITYLFEGREKKYWYFNHYWTPKAQENFNEATVLISFLDSLNSITNFTYYSNQFSEENTFISYRYYGASYTVNTILTKKEMRDLKRKSKHNER